MTDHMFTIHREVPTTELFEHETGIEDNQHTDIVAVSNDTVDVSAADEPSIWWSHEFRAVHSSPWFVANVENGEYGPTVTFERDE